MSHNKFFNIKSLLLSSLFILTGYSCANYKLHIAKEAEGWNQKKLPAEKPEHVVFLIGDVGKSPKEGIAPALAMLEEQLEAAAENSTCVFLGDNIYPLGMPTKDDPVKRAYAEFQLDAQLRVLKDYPGRPIFIPGNHDWYSQGISGVVRQKKYIQKKLNEGIADKDEWQDYFLPKPGCAGPDVIELNDQLVMVVIDTQWWLENWDRNPEINSDCEIKSRESFFLAFEEALRKHRSKNVIIAMHHPLESGGPHGGKFPLKDHVFPFTIVNPNAYIPLPVLGSVPLILRSTIGVTQDIAHPKYRRMKKDLLRAAKKNGNFIFVSGHEHTLQYIQANRQHFVVSGSGAKTNEVKLINGAEFAYGAKGFARLDIYEDGRVWLSFFASDKEYPEGREVFRKQIKEALPIEEYDMPEEFTEYQEMKDSIDSQVTRTLVIKKGPVHNFLLGSHYRNVYIPEYKFPTLDLSTFKGGMEVVQRGGGNQTNSLRLVDPTGKEWVMRSMTKDASRFIPYPFNKITGTQAIVEDNFLSTHPFAAIVIPDLADAIKVYHTNPKIYYVPKQPTLGLDNQAYGGELYLVEERPDEDWSDEPSFGNSKDIVSTPKVVERVVKNGKHQIDEPWLLRSRLFDMVIGDFDRHDDQWRWASFEDKEKDITFYRPIPRDRDQPFAKYNGLAPFIARLSLPFLKQLRPYEGDVKNVKWSNYGGRQIDQSFLTRLEWSEWEKQIKKIQTGLTDEVIEEAFRQNWPDPAYSMSAREIISFMKERRDNLLETGRELYEFRAKEVDVVGSEKDDLFEVTRKNDKETMVKVYRMRDKGNQLTYERTFYTDETQEIRLYGLDDNDVFKITGEVNHGIKVRLIGGLGKDEFIDKSKGGKTLVYDVTSETSVLDISPQTKNKISNRTYFNLYNRKDYQYEYDFLMPFPLIGFNPDDGLFLGANITITNYEFKKSPFAASHNVQALFALATNAFSLKYTGDYLETFGKWDFLLRANIVTPQFVDNFFGLGNQTVNLEKDDLVDIDFYRVRRFNFELNPNFKRRFAFGAGTIRFGPTLEASNVEQTEGRVLVEDDNLGIRPQVFNTQWFGGVAFDVGINNVNDVQMPTTGVRFNTGASWKVNLRETNRDFFKFYGNLTFYFATDYRENIILATRVGFEHNEGDFEFYQGAILDGNSNFRGFRRDRFYGTTSFYHQTDLRCRIGYVKDGALFPFSYGITAGFDHGRVWLDGEISDVWHVGYGGGIWIAPVDFFVINSSLFRGEGANLIRVTLGFNF